MPEDWRAPLYGLGVPLFDGVTYPQPKPEPEPEDEPQDEPEGEADDGA